MILILHQKINLYSRIVCDFLNILKLNIMKPNQAISILTILLFVIAGCGGGKQSGNLSDDLIIVDVMATSYPKKELILQDFMDVEYIPLETNDEFVNQGFVQDIGKEFIVLKNRKDDGDIFLYDRTGKAIRKINRKGEGGEEYTNLFGILLDESNKELFVNDIYKKTIYVYDLYGNFKRRFAHKEGNGSQFYTDIFNYDKDNLICYDEYNEEVAFVLVSKQDGSIHDIQLPFEKKKLLQQQKQDGDITYTISPGPHRSIIPFKGDWILFELSSDTTYTLLPDHNIRPFLVRTPPIQSMTPEVFLMLRLFSDRYLFMETIKNTYDFDAKTGFSRTFLVYDKQEKDFFKYTVYNGDYSTKKEIYMNMLRPVDHEIDSWQSIDAHRLVESYEKGELKGDLKEIAATLDEESNPVIMLVKHKK